MRGIELHRKRMMRLGKLWGRCAAYCAHAPKSERLGGGDCGGAGLSIYKQSVG